MHIDLCSRHFNLLRGLNKYTSIQHTHANHSSKNNSLQTFRRFSTLFPVTPLLLPGTIISTGRDLPSKKKKSHSEKQRGSSEVQQGLAEGSHQYSLSINGKSPAVQPGRCREGGEQAPVPLLIHHRGIPQPGPWWRDGASGHQAAQSLQSPRADISLRGQKSTSPSPVPLPRPKSPPADTPAHLVGRRGASRKGWYGLLLTFIRTITTWP